jgi:hypothetical protein
VVHAEVDAVRAELVHALREVDRLVQRVAGRELAPAAERPVVSEREGSEALHDDLNRTPLEVFR